MSDDEKTLIQLRAAQKKREAQAAHGEANLRETERKARTRKLIDVGGLVEKAGLLGLSKNKLYGGLRFMEKHREAHEEAWGVDGGQSFAEDARRRDEGQDKLLIIFPAPLPKGAGALLKKAGFLFSKVLDLIDDLGADISSLEINYDNLKKFAKLAREFQIYIASNTSSLINYGERYRAGERISSAFVESTVNSVISKRFAKKPQMQWSQRGAHLLPQARTRALDGTLRAMCERWYPRLANDNSKSVIYAKAA